MRTTQILLPFLLAGCNPAGGTDASGDTDSIDIPVDDAVRGSCPAALTCAAVAAPSEFDDLQAAYGSRGTCFDGEVDPAACRAACEDLLRVFAFQATENKACPSFAWTKAYSSWGTTEAEVTAAKCRGDIRVGDRLRVVLDRVIPDAPNVTIQYPFYLWDDVYRQFERRGGLDMECEVRPDGSCTIDANGTDDYWNIDYAITLDLKDVKGRFVDVVMTVQRGSTYDYPCEYTVQGRLGAIPDEKDGDYWTP